MSIKYRQLGPHEIIRVGDVYWSAARDDIDPRNGIGLIVKNESDGAGKRADFSGNTHFRPSKEDNWIAFSERKPTKEDAYHAASGRVSGYDNLVAVLFYDGSVGIGGIQCAADGEYWMPLNFVPREPTRIKIGGYEVIPNNDGSIKVGCQTVASKDFEEIIRQRNEAMK